MALREYIRDNGMSGAETDRTAVYTRYQLSVEKSQRLKSTWTLQQYEGCYNREFYNLVKEANPCAMCKRMIINAGISTVVVRDTPEDFRVTYVYDEWVMNDESLEGKRGY